MFSFARPRPADPDADGRYDEFRRCVGDLIGNETVLSMREFMQHGDITCLEHCLQVAYCSYLACRLLRLDYRSAARGALLHDLFLYDWHGPNPYRGLHAFNHPLVALRNASGQFTLTARESDIIRKHMWPLTPAFPRYRESLIVSLADKYCAVRETIGPPFRRHLDGRAGGGGSGRNG